MTPTGSLVPEIRGVELIGLFVYQSKAFNEGDSKGLLSKDL